MRQAFKSDRMDKILGTAKKAKKKAEMKSDPKSKKKKSSKC